MHAPFAATSETSEAAAESIEPSRVALCRSILAFVASRFDMGATCDEIEAALGLAHQTASARVWELRGAGCVAETSMQRGTRRGRMATVIIATGKPFVEAARPLSAASDYYVVRDSSGAILSVIRAASGMPITCALDTARAHGFTVEHVAGTQAKSDSAMAKAIAALARKAG